jgi:hypothetical protein
VSDNHPLPFERTKAETIWLHSDHLPTDERLARLLGDERLLVDLVAADFEGPDWDFVEEQLLRYGLTVISSWIRSGLIVAKCAEKNVRARIPRPEARVPDTAEEIALDVITVGIVKFRDDVLLRGRYDPKKGASLSTFYIGQCLFQYDNQMAKWENHELPTPRISDHEVEMSMFDVHRKVGTEDDAIRTVMVQMILGGASNDMAARVLAMSALDYSMEEVARSVGKSLHAVKGILKREKQLLRLKNDEGELG